MTGMEQNLRYIEREIRFMVKDQFGNATYAKYADRVIEDTCGIPNFCSTVLSSEKPLVIILKALRGSRGEVIMRFFNVALHDARIDMVMVLAEASKLRINRNRSSKDAYEYLMKLYRKAIKRTIRLTTGNKDKDSYKSMYRALKEFANIDDFGYDDDDDEDYIDTGSDFGDIDFAEECLDAYRNGQIPPQMKQIKRKPALIDSNNAEDIVNQIASIEAKIGRPLTDAELDDLLCGDDEDDIDTIDSIYPRIPHEFLKEDSDKMFDAIVNSIYERLMEKIADNNAPHADLSEKTKPALQPEENIDDVNKLVSVVTHPTNNNYAGESLLSTDSLEDLVEMHNHLKNNSPNKDEDTSGDAEESSQLPPNDTLGGTSKMLVAEFSNNNPEVEKSMNIEDIVKDFKNIELFNSNLSNKLRNYFNALGFDIADIFITLMPATSISHLFTLKVTIRAMGDYEIIDNDKIDMLIRNNAKTIADNIGISEDIIDIDLNIIDASTDYNSDLSCLSSKNKIINSDTMIHLNSALCSMIKYVYDTFLKSVSIRYINYLPSKEFSIYFLNKDGSVLDSDLIDFIDREMIDAHIVSYIIDFFKIRDIIASDIVFHTTSASEEEFCSLLQKTLNNEIINDQIDEYSKMIDVSIIDYLADNHNISAQVSSQHLFAQGEGNIYIDNMHEISLSAELTHDEVNSLKENLSLNGEFRIQLRDFLHAISSNVQVSQYLSFSINHDDIEATEEESDVTDVKTSNFGI